MVSNNAEQKRTVPCIALYPTGNANGSWWLLSLNTKKRVRRTNWEKMVTSDVIINIMNSYSEDAEDAAIEEDDEGDDDVLVVQDPPADVLLGDKGSHVVQADSGDAGVDEDADQHHRPTTQPTGSTLSWDDDAVNTDVHAVAHVNKAGVSTGKMYRSYHTSVRKGLDEHGALAYKAIVAELKQLLVEKKAMVPVHRGDLSARQLKKTIRSLMFLKTKFDGLGRFEKLKARLVANGKQQDRELYPDTFSPTVKLQSVMMGLVLAAAEGRKVWAIDIGGAYLNADRTSEDGEEIIMELEPLLVSILAKVAPSIKPYVDEKGRVLVKLTKAMYGTLDAAKIWYEKLTCELKKMGLDGVELRVRFHHDHPIEPPFIWVHKPRLIGGRVFQGGAMCMDLLMPQGWSPANTIPAVMRAVRSEIEGETKCYEHFCYGGKGGVEILTNTYESAQQDFKFIQSAHSSWQGVVPRNLAAEAAGQAAAKRQKR